MTNRIQTIHTSRTMMFNELSALIDHQVFDEKSIVEMNILGKLSTKGIHNTLNYLSRLYDFKEANQLWKVFLYLWNMAEESDKRIMTLLYALYKDELLRVSLPVMLNAKPGKKVEPKAVQDAIGKAYPGRYAPTTSISAAQNILSSWKQAGYIEGKVKNIRVAVKPDAPAVLFALFLGYKEGKVGEDLLQTTWVYTLEISQEQLHELLAQASLRDLIGYRKAGGITIIQFEPLLNHIE